jgi:hypothetical protein
LGQKKSLAYCITTKIFQERNVAAFIEQNLKAHWHEHFGQLAILWDELGIG